MWIRRARRPLELALWVGAFWTGFQANIAQAQIERIDIDAKPVEVKPVSVTGSQLTYSNGTIFQIRGITYDDPNSDFPDPLADFGGCMRDVYYLLDLNINVVQVSNIDPSANHTDCMQLFAKAGIYVIASFNDDMQYLSAVNPMWDSGLYEHYRASVDFLAKWNNTLGFRIEPRPSIDSIEDTTAMHMPFVKKVVDDLKKYMQNMSYRDIPIGYNMPVSALSDPSMVDIRLDYLTCGSMVPDFVTMDLGDCPHEARIEMIVEAFAEVPMPVWVEKMGCGSNTYESTPRHFEDVNFVFSDFMSRTLSGGVLYEFNGLPDTRVVNSSDDSNDPLPIYSRLSQFLAAVDPPSPTSIPIHPPNPTTTKSCPASNAAWPVPPTALPPSPRDQMLCRCMMQQSACIGMPSLLERNTPQEIEELFMPLCNNGRSRCPGIRISPQEGMYGAFSICNVTERYSWATSWLNKTEGRACEVDGRASASQNELEMADMEEGCVRLLEQVGEDGKGTTTASGETAATLGPTSVVSREETEESQGLSSSAITGIVVGALISFALVLLGVVLYLKRLRKLKEHKDAGMKGELVATIEGKKEAPMVIEGRGNISSPVVKVSEMDAPRRCHELGMNSPRELPCERH